MRICSIDGDIDGEEGAGITRRRDFGFMTTEVEVVGGWLFETGKRLQFQSQDRIVPDHRYWTWLCHVLGSCHDHQQHNKFCDLMLRTDAKWAIVSTPGLPARVRVGEVNLPLHPTSLVL